MQIEILGTESLGVRGLCCVVKTDGRTIVFDPGVALGYQRGGLLPHPLQVAVGEGVRRDIEAALKDATDVVISHFHGDHMPLPDANPYQLKADLVADSLQSVRLWVKGTDDQSHRMRQRVQSFSHIIRRTLPNAEGRKSGPFTFSTPMPHGGKNGRLGTVMMTRVESDSGVFVHASDVQLLDDQPIFQILRWQPTVLLISGPPLYRRLSLQQREAAWERAVALARQVRTCIIDHHLLRCEESISWLERLSEAAGHQVICAADFMKQPRRLLEARRAELYRRIPVPAGWHEAYSLGLADTSACRALDGRLGEDL